MIAPCRLYLDATGKRVVFGDDPDAAFLLCGAGAEIPAGFSLPTPPEPEKPEATPVRKPSPRATKKP